MTSYSAMAARGREAAREATAGRRKVIAERIDYVERADYPPHNVTALPGGVIPARTHVAAYLIGSCGHTLRWLASVPVHEDGPAPGAYLTAKLGRRMTCQHDDCRIPPKVT
jgi:hypothetical protein